ncbi:MAG: DUF1002 domain-containing protein [Eubacteriales bacterium]|nr:DUF1002 domain-containing protein [Eubacteriales bacterium]
MFKRKSLTALFLGLLIFFNLTATPVLAGQLMQAQKFIDLDQPDERWGKPVFAYGQDLSEAELIETAMLFGIRDWAQVKPIAISAADRIRYVDPTADPGARMFSSVLVQRRDSGLGVQVYLMTPEQITNITAAQYAGSAITAGVTDARIVVGTVKQATGDSALTGVYKAFAQEGEELSEARVQLAQEELELVSSIAQENAAKEGFSILSYDQAMVEIKKLLAARTEELSQALKPGELDSAEAEEKLKLSPSEIAKVVEEVLQDFDLGQILSAEQQAELSNYFSKWQQSDAAKSDEIKEQLKDLADRLINYGSQLVQELKDNGSLDKVKDLSIEGLKKAGELAKEGYRQAEESGLLSQIGNFVKQLVTELFNSLRKIFSN